MATATLSPRMYASTAAKELGVSLPSLAEALGKEPDQIRPRTPVSREVIDGLRQQIVARLDETPEPAVEEAQPGVEVGTALRVTDTVLHHKGGRKARQRDWDIAKQLKAFIVAYRKVKLPFVPDTVQQGGSMFVYDSPVTGKPLKLNLGEYSECKRVGNFPIITEQDRRDAAMQLGELWCVHRTCTHCGDQLNPLLLSKLNHLLKGRYSLPLIGRGERIKFRAGHNECRLMMPKLVALELEMQEFTGTEAEAVAYRQEQYVLMAGEILPEARRNEEKITKQDIYSRMLKILNRYHVNHGVAPQEDE